MSDEKNSLPQKNQIEPIGLKNNILVRELEAELLLYDLDRDKAFCLNETALLIWNFCDGENSVEDIRSKVGSRLKTPVSEDLIGLALDSLKNEKLLINHRRIEIDFAGLSRRQSNQKSWGMPR